MPPRTPEQISREEGRVLKRGPRNVAEIKEWLGAVEGKRRDAENTDNTAGTRMDAAYDAILYAGLAMLCAEGWRSGGEPGHHKAVIEATSALLQLKQSQHDELDALREWRNRKYRGAPTPTPSELSTALQWARRIHERSARWFETTHARLLKG